MSLPRCSLLVVIIIPVILLVPGISFIYLHLSHEPVLSDGINKLNVFHLLGL